MHRKSALFALFCIIGACAQGSEPLPSSTGGGDESSGESSSSSSGNAQGGMGGSGGAQGGMGGAGGAQGGMGGIAGSGGAGTSSSMSAASSSSSSAASSSSSAASSSSSSGGGTCPGTIIDWNWNMGTAPTNLTYGGVMSSWGIGAATGGPADAMTYLATRPAVGSYPDGADAWAMLPAIDLSGYTTCQFRVSVELWRNSEKYGLANYDGGNLQYTLDATGTTGWQAVTSTTMAYDGNLTDCTNSCLLVNQKAWTSSADPKWKNAIFESVTPPGSMVRYRFTFHSDINNNNGPLPGIYVRRFKIDAF